MKYYFAGALFNHKELVGNRLLMDAVSAYSAGKWQANFPQETSENQFRPSPLQIRDHDLALVMESDAALIHFDGSELDSGTVAEFMVARFLDLPCVLFRSDFRSAGDQNADDAPWNLMLSGYPRTVVVRYNAMAQYQQFFRALPTAEALKAYYDEMGSLISNALNEVHATAPVLKNKAERINAFQTMIRLCGGNLADLFPDEKLLALPGIYE